MFNRLFLPKQIGNNNAWQVTKDTWGTLNNYEIARLCVKKQYEKAENLAMDCFDKVKEQPITTALFANALHNLAFVYQVQEKFDEALKYRLQARENMIQKMECEFPGAVKELEEKMTKLAYICSLPNYETKRGFFLLAGMLHALGDTYMGLKNYSMAIENYDKAQVMRRLTYHVNDAHKSRLMMEKAKKCLV